MLPDVPTPRHVRGCVTLQNKKTYSCCFPIAFFGLLYSMLRSFDGLFRSFDGLFWSFEGLFLNFGYCDSFGR